MSNVGSWFASIGSAIVSGIVSGVENGARALHGSLRSLAGNALSSAKSFLGINSPSTAFAEQVGQWIPHGVAASIRAHAPTAVAAVTDMGACPPRSAPSRLRTAVAWRWRAAPVPPRQGREVSWSMF
ncbi:hypothetical protein [Streptomyces sp. UNOC14_S4]|uniref:hypothetical protein n=1 Tax=Streptomyces sp. UNOC14_S4 TaxID=2872340 RepID=UPI001E63029B|nr:hypothetical protein [Streptomyces sp. UNOC14_S4]MCC3769164.1 hypothetical protein [Streptomyces sp. UNOC14_S4]